MIVNAPVISLHIVSGKFRAIAVVGEQRPPAFPDVQTTKEAGMPDFIPEKGFFGAYVQAGPLPEIGIKLV